MEGTIGTPSATESMQRIIANLDKISTDWQYLSQQNREKLTQAVTDLASTTSRIKGILDANEGKFEETLDNINEGSQKFVEVASKLDTLSQSVHKLLSNLESGEGTLGRALKDDSLYNQLVSATVNLDSLITDFKKHPKKYVKLSIF
jgi:phospholipid/cholesterol/gamma-HCH transport system substrate-binding protein